MPSILSFILCLSFVFTVRSAAPHLRGVSPSEKHFYQPQTEFTCRFTGNKIPFDRVNDNYCDCSDGSDEPGTSACSNGQFFCRNKPFEPKFIPSSQVNDGTCDCCDGSDEYLSGKCSNNCKEIASRSISQKQEELRSYKLGVETKKTYIAQAAQTFQEKQQLMAQIQNALQEQEKIVEVLKVAKEEAEKAEREELLRDAEEAERKKKEQEEQAQAGQPQDQQQPEQSQEQPVATEEKKEEELAPEATEFVDDDDDDDRDDDRDDDDEIVAAVQEDKLSEVGKRANQARDEYRKAQQQLDSKQVELTDVQKILSNDYGPQREFMPLYEKCVQYRTPEYVYEMCPYGNAKQAGTSLGHFSGWESGHSIMKFSDGASCWGGPKRSLTVHLKCGAEEQILNVHEPSKCTYEMDFTTPAACDMQHLLVLELNMQELFSDSPDEE